MASPKVYAQNERNFNADWQFTLTDSLHYTLETYDTKDWRTLDVPHDWSVEFDFDPIKGEPCTGSLLGGIGWYSKSFDTPIKANQKCFILFDGVYNNSSYWINGRKLGEHPYGYSPFYYDLTDYMKIGSQGINTNIQDINTLNRISVRVDHSRYADSRWYTGSGIYRNVKMIVTDKFYIPVWGTYLTTPKVSTKRATVDLKVSLKNEYKTSKKAIIRTQFIDAKGKVAATKTATVQLAAGDDRTITQAVTITKPMLWDTENPTMYKAVTTVELAGKTVQTYTTPFGIRSILFDKEKGFFLNGKSMKVKGVCLHHDGGLVGAAVPKDVWRRRFQILKDGGCNAIRTSHNPISDEFLDLCDEMGFLVQEEFFDEWDYPKDKRVNKWERSVDYITRGYVDHFQEWAERDLKTTMLRSRNHPSIFQWSIGNEIEWTYKHARDVTGYWRVKGAKGFFRARPPYTPEEIRRENETLPRTETYDIGETAQKLAKWTREMDTTRPITANCILPTGSFETGYADALDIVGFSYRHVIYDYAREFYPDKCVMGTENVPQWHEWKAIQERDFIAGTYYWTGVDYMGESRGWDDGRGFDNGMLDYAGFPKASYYNMKAIWTDEPCIHIYSDTEAKSLYKKAKNGLVVEKKKGSWQTRSGHFQEVNAHWNYKQGESVIVEIYSNCDEIELLQDGKSLGTVKLADCPDHIYKWAVTYRPGKLVAKGKKGDVKVEETLYTEGEPVAVRLTTDRTAMKANGADAMHVIAQLIDANGRPVTHTERNVSFMVNGECKVLGVDNGADMNYNPYQSSSVDTWNGRALMIIQSKRDAVGEIAVRAMTNDGLTSKATSTKVSARELAAYEKPKYIASIKPGMGVADPHVWMHKDTLYAVCGHDEGWDSFKSFQMDKWQVWKTGDLENWEMCGELHPRDTYVGDHPNCWAGDICERNNKYYWFFSNRSTNTGVMVADNIEGPYKDLIGKPLLPENIIKEHPYDPEIFVENGEYYIIFGVGQYYIATLSKDMKKLTTKPKPIMVYDSLNRRARKKVTTSDKPTVFKRGDWYYLVYGHRYAMSKELAGPYLFKGRFLDGGHTSMFNWYGQWYVMQENHDISSCYRGVTLKPIHFNKDGSIIVPEDDTFYPGPGRQWDFKTSIMGWKPVNDATCEWDGKDMIYGTVSAKKATVRSAPWLYTDYKKCSTLSVTIKNDSPATEMEVAVFDRVSAKFWQEGNREPDWNSLTWTTVPVKAQSKDFETYTIDLTKIPNRKARVMLVAVRPASNATTGKWAISDITMK